MQKTLKYTIFKTKWGYFGLAGAEYGLLRTYLPSPKPETEQGGEGSRRLAKQGGFASENIKSQLLKNSALVNRVSSIKYRESSIEYQVSRIEFDKTFFKATQEQITAYFEGTRVNFSDVPIILDGFSFFVSSVLTACRDIGFGQTTTYGGLAKKLGRVRYRRTARAIGSALAKNPLPLIIPCHRIVRSDGKIGGFSAPGGVKLKKRLLQFEQEVPQQPKT